MLPQGVKDIFYTNSFDYNIAKCLNLNPVKEFRRQIMENMSSWLLKNRTISPVIFQWDPMTNFCKKKLFPGWLKYLGKASKIYDYSLFNKPYYDDLELEFNFLEMNTFAFQPPKYKKDIDFLFYGYIPQSNRRLEVLYRLHKKYITYSPLNNYGEEFEGKSTFLSIEKQIEFIGRSKYVLDININDHPNRCNNPGRIMPALSYGGKVISEECDEEWFNKKIGKLGVEVMSYNDILNL